MAFSVFEVIGPPMVGPSSSHTAGACRIGWAARTLFATQPFTGEVGLHGSFAATGAGHGTREALAAGLLGLSPDDERLKDALALAVEAGITLRFYEIDLGPQAHPNSVRIDLEAGGRRLELVAASVGGGSIIITGIDGLPTEIHGTLETLVLWHLDTCGFLAHVTAVLAAARMNVASIRTSRRERGEDAVTTVEVDGRLPSAASAFLAGIEGLSRLAILPVLPGF